MEGHVVRVVAPITAGAIVAQQIGSNASRDALFLSQFAVTTLPYFVAAAALLSFPASRLSGRLLVRFGPQRIVPYAFALGAVSFLMDWLLMSSHPRAVATLLFFQSSILGSLTISAFWSLLNERFDPRAAKGLMGRVAAGAALGGLLGGLGAERVAALLSASTLLAILGLVGLAGVGGALLVARDAKHRAIPTEPPAADAGLSEIRRSPLLRNLALVTVLAAIVGTLTDYMLKASATAHLARPEDLLRFFGVFYAATGIGAFVLQMAAGRAVLARLGLAGSVTVHPLAVGVGGLLSLIAPTPWLSVVPRGLDMCVRNSTFRAGYELLYAPLPESSKRRSKPFIDVGCDSVGKGIGALVALLLSSIGGATAILLVTAAGILAAAAELVIARRIHPAYVSALQDGLRRQVPGLEHPIQFALADFTIARSMVGIDRQTIRAAVRQKTPAGSMAEPVGSASLPASPILVIVGEIRSGASPRIREALRDLPIDPLIVAALIPVLERSDLVNPVIEALTAQSARAAGQVVDALTADDTPEVVRRRLPIVLRSWNSPRALQGLIDGLQDRSPEVRRRCSRALLSLTTSYPALIVPPAEVLAAVEAALDSGGSDDGLREQIFNLLALVLDRQAVRIARHAFEGTDEYLRGTALEYLDSVLPPSLVARLIPSLGASPPTGSPRRAAGAVHADLLRAGETMTVSREAMRKHPTETAGSEAEETDVEDVEA
jgi:AAA family ATP:ADP antiporter